MKSDAEPRRRGGSGLVRIAAMAAGVLLLYAAISLGPLWVRVWWTGMERTTRRTMSVGFLMTCLAGYGLALTAAPIAGSIAMVRLVQGRRRGERRRWSARVLLLSLTLLLGAGLLDLGAWGLVAWNRLPPSTPTVPSEAKVPEQGGKSGELQLLVLGESSAEGQPFEPWFSIGHAVGWQVERANPGRSVHIEMTASGGIPLAYTLQVIAQQTRRPDIVLLVSGHNEFQARWGWSRVVNYYVDDIKERPRDRLIDHVGDLTPFTRLIRDAVERQAIDLPPVPKERREVVDRPVCEPESRSAVAFLFRQELETIVAWCQKAGAVPIFVIPAGNDVGFDPDRSVLDPRTRKAEREKFGREFLAARALEKSDPEAAMAALRTLIARQPLFAESHYRLAQLLQAKGEIDEARSEYAIARDRDGLPMRCPSEFQDVYRQVAAEHPEVVLIDAPKILTEFSPTKLLDDSLFHDGQHPSYRAYLRLAQEAIDALRDRGLFGLREAGLPPLDPQECAEHFGLTDREKERWSTVCGRAASFWGRLASSRYDPSERAERAARLNRAREEVLQGTRPEATGVPGLGIKPEGFP